MVATRSGLIHQSAALTAQGKEATAALMLDGSHSLPFAAQFRADLGSSQSLTQKLSSSLVAASPMPLRGDYLHEAQVH